MYTTLIDAARLATLPASNTRVFDCRHDMKDSAAGGRAFAAGHIPGAAHLDLDRDLSGPVVAGRTGRHPLPDRSAFRELLRRHGVTAATQLVAYDDNDGLFAARLWWMVRWAGHTPAAVLDGGYRAWLALQAGDATPPSAAALPPQPVPAPQSVDMATVQQEFQASRRVLLDARAADRFRGENETMDPKGGHIPGAVNAPYQGNVDADGRFLTPDALRAHYAGLLDAHADKPVICYCGSGVSATHTALAMLCAGLPEPALYVGSWSEWITCPENPIET